MVVFLWAQTRLRLPLNLAADAGDERWGKAVFKPETQFQLKEIMSNQCHKHWQK